MTDLVNQREPSSSLCGTLSVSVYLSAVGFHFGGGICLIKTVAECTHTSLDYHHSISNLMYVQLLAVV